MGNLGLGQGGTKMKHAVFYLCFMVFIILSAAAYPLELYEAVELDYSTYLGGTDIEYGNAITVDSNGSAYVAGSTDSSDFPTVNPYQGYRTDAAFIAKFSEGGSELIFSTYLSGSSSTSYGYGVAIDSDFNVYVTGETGSSSFPTVNPYQSSHAGGNENVFISKLSSSGSELLYSTYLGGSGNHEEPYQIVVDSNNCAYVTGNTTSTDFPVVNPYQSSYAGGGSPEIIGDAFVTKFSSSGSALIFSTYLGGSDGDGNRDMALGPDNSVYMAGRSSSDNFPTVNAYQSSRAWNIDATVSKLSSSGSALIYSTYLGGDHHDTGRGIDVDSTGHAYITGSTFSDDFPTLNPYQASRIPGDYDAFVTKFETSGSKISFSTYLGGDDEDSGDGISLGLGNFAYITGSTYSSNFPMVNAYQSSYSGNGDAFVSRFSCRGLTLLFSTYLGGNNADDGTRVVVDSQGSAYIIGTTQSNNFPLENPYQSTPDESWGNAFVTKIFQTSTNPIYASGDYDGDGDSDIAIFRPKSGLWAIRGVTRAYYGSSQDRPIPGDYNGDGTADIGVFRQSSGLWAVRGLTRIYFGGAGDQAVPSDYNGDNICDVGIYRSATGLWAIRGVTRIYYGTDTDTPIPGDYSGSGKTGLAIFRPETGLWAIRGITRVYYGHNDDQVAPGDYDGDGKWEICVFRTCIGLWARPGVTRFYFGDCEDQSIPADYNGDGTDDIAIYRPPMGLWAVRGLTRAYYGSLEDMGVTR